MLFIVRFLWVLFRLGWGVSLFRLMRLAVSKSREEAVWTIRRRVLFAIYSTTWLGAVVGLLGEFSKWYILAVVGNGLMGAMCTFCFWYVPCSKQFFNNYPQKWLRDAAFLVLGLTAFYFACEANKLG